MKPPSTLEELSSLLLYGKYVVNIYGPDEAFGRNLLKAARGESWVVWAGNMTFRRELLGDLAGILVANVEFVHTENGSRFSVGVQVFNRGVTSPSEFAKILSEIDARLQLRGLPALEVETEKTLASRCFAGKPVHSIIAYNMEQMSRALTASVTIDHLDSLKFKFVGRG